MVTSMLRIRNEEGRAVKKLVVYSFPIRGSGTTVSTPVLQSVAYETPVWSRHDCTSVAAPRACYLVCCILKKREAKFEVLPLRRETAGRSVSEVGRAKKTGIRLMGKADLNSLKHPHCK